MASQIFSQSDGEVKRRDFEIMLSDSNGDPVDDQDGGQPRIRKPGETAYTDTNATMTFSEEGHYVVVLTVEEISELGNFTVRYQGGSSLEFGDVGHVQPGGLISNASLKDDLRKVIQKLNKLEFLLQGNTADEAMQQELEVM